MRRCIMKCMNNVSDYTLLLRAFGDKLRYLRKKQMLTQEELAGVAGFNRSYYSDIENGKRNISFIGISKLASALNVEMRELLPAKEDYYKLLELDARHRQETITYIYGSTIEGQIHNTLRAKE
ncbi:helix-turn-helix domain-containing protein [Terribacillus halophilus]|uniref:helix-turn-helix domain-containing protein n=1 Tax=Terribacillus halophilus TaxID=361279 RepID=UPI002117C9FF|nr:helix-turn-helix transcriptional regulator [Terribacillus halophilus]